MEFKSENKNNGPANGRIEPIPSVSPVKSSEIPHRVALTECSWPFLGSIALHAVLFEVLFFPALQMPTVVTSRAPTVLWFTPFVVPGDNGHTAEIQNQPDAVAFARQTNTTESDNAAEPVLNDSPEDTTADDHSTTPPIPVPSTGAETGDKPATADSMVIQTPHKVQIAVDRHLFETTPVPRQAMTLPPSRVSLKPTVASSLKPLQEVQQVLPAEQSSINRVEMEQADRERIERQSEEDRLSREQEREAQDKLQQERKIQEKAAAERARRAQRAREQEQQALREQSERERVAAEKARQEHEAQGQLIRKHQEEAARRKKMEQPLEQPIRGQVAAAVKHQEPPAPGISAKHTGQPAVQQPQKGLVLPLLKGDLKLVVTGIALPKATITFKEFALSRRNRPFSRTEARREIKIVPLTANTQENTREFVIGRVNPGVYSITIEPFDGPTDVIFLLKLYEGTSRMMVKNLGRHSLARKVVLLKILMPEGILWDDNAAFSGNMEDSDGVTKFNSETGLMWKEYAN